MAGRGFAPGPAERKTGHRKPEEPRTIINFEPGIQPELPDSIEWPGRTREWWQMWADSPLSDNFMSTDWDFLLDTALLHASVWGDGDFGKLPELRIRVAKFGATPEDRARLRIQFADADAADGGRGAAVASARARRPALVLAFPGTETTENTPGS
jgi:hypothetical protein